MTDELPGGTITFLFTDIEGSTRLLKRLGDEYALVLAEHHRLFRTLFDEHGRPARCEDGIGRFLTTARPIPEVLE